jgi:hypothetical protein
MSNELTPDQANDCARYFLGREWSAALNERTGSHVLLRVRGVVRTYASSNWPDVFRSAGIVLPQKSAEKFVAVDQDVKRGSETWARAVSHSFAKRIAKALNAQTADRMGQ